MEIIGHLTAAPGPIDCTNAGLGPLTFPSPSARPRNRLNPAFQKYKISQNNLLKIGWSCKKLI